MENIIKQNKKRLKSDVITEAHIKGGMSYKEYRGLIEQLLIGGQTTGENQSAAMIDYTRNNVQRMNRLDSRIVLDDLLLMTLHSLKNDWYWVVLTEAWCGDAAENIPILAKIASATPRIRMKLLLRDEYPELFNHYTAENNKSIPLLICLTQEELVELGTWGPRPAPVQKIVSNYKMDAKNTQEEFMQNIIQWYRSDRGNTLQNEMNVLIQEWNSK